MLKIVFPFTLSTTMLNLANYNLKTEDGCFDSHLEVSF